MSNTIDFMCIGATRAGTTWLWNMLTLHPGIWMPPIKELHYFDRSFEYPSPSLLADDRFVDRLFGRKRHHRLFRRLFIRSMGKTLLSPQKWSDFRWLMHYFLGTYNDAWYLSLFDQKEDLVKGEITPAYSILSEKDVKHINTLFPALKVIYLIRNPVDRAWSDMRLRSAKQTLDIQDQQEIIRTIDSPSQANRSDYLRTLLIWSSCFPQKQILVCFFDEIVKQPQPLVKKICQFLGVDPAFPLPLNQLTNKVNASKEIPIPGMVQSYLATKYLPEVKKLIPLVGGYAETWLQEIEAILKNREDQSSPGIASKERA